MSTTTITSVNLPAHMFAHDEVKIKDNTLRVYSSNTDNFTKVLCIFMSPEGEDGKIRSITKGKPELIKHFGDGPFSIYGQPWLNAKAAADTNVTVLQCMRITAKDAKYANKHVYIRYRVTDEVKEGETVKTPAKLQIAFVTKSDNALTDIKDLAKNAPAASVGSDGWTETRFMSFAAKGRGAYGDQLRVRVSNNYRSDKVTPLYKNYFLDIFKNSSNVQTSRFCLTPDAIIAGNNYFIESVVNDDLDSQYIACSVNDAILPTLFNLYQTYIDPDTTLTVDTFDPILGINKGLATAKSVNWTEFADATSAQIANLEIIDDATIGTIQLNSVVGFALSSGSDGAFAMGTAGRETAINERFAEAFRGKIDRNILSRNRVPLDAMFDANYDFNIVKPAMADLCGSEEMRQEDFICYFDLNTDLDTLSAPYENAVDLDIYTNHWTFSIDGYMGKVIDPYNKRIVTVTSTYNLIQKLPLLWKANNGKHIPYAGDYGVIDTFIENTVFPVYDDSIDAAYLDKLTDAHVNYAQIDAKGRVIRGAQSSRYPVIDGSMASTTMSDLTELHRGHIVLDVKKDALKIAAEFKFHENEDLSLFNKKLDRLKDKYASSQVKKIYTSLYRTEEEAEAGILHLTIDIENKGIIKYVMIDINVNRMVEES